MKYDYSYDYLDDECDIGYYGFIRKPSCHQITQIYKNFFLCNAHQIIDAMQNGMKFDVLIPLAGLDARVWKYTSPTQTQIFYFPCPDFGIIDDELLNYLVSHIINFIKQGKKVALFCEGGHGRTGYIGSCVIGKLGVKNPVQEIRSRYCEKTIETIDQLKSIANFLNINLDKEIEVMLHEKFISNLISAITTVIRKEEQLENAKLKEGEPKIKYDVSWLYKCTDKELMELGECCGILDKNGNIIYSKFYSNYGRK